MNSLLAAQPAAGAGDGGAGHCPGLSPLSRACPDNAGTKGEPAQGGNSSPARPAAALAPPPQTRFRGLRSVVSREMAMELHPNAGQRPRRLLRPFPAPGMLPALRVQPQLPHRATGTEGVASLGTSPGRRENTKNPHCLSFTTGSPASPLSTRHRQPRDAGEEEPPHKPTRARPKPRHRGSRAGGDRPDRLGPRPGEPLEERLDMRRTDTRTLGHSDTALPPDPPSPRVMMRHEAVNCWKGLSIHSPGGWGAALRAGLGSGPATPGR